MATSETNYIKISEGGTWELVVFKASQVRPMCFQVSEPLLQIKNTKD